MKKPLFVKLCGMTCSEDIALAIELGAQAIGLIFYPKSPRAVSPEQAQKFCAHLPENMARVGVFVNENVADMQSTAQRVGLSHIQLHGQEPPEVLQALAEGPQQIIRAVRLSANPDSDEIQKILNLPTHIQLLLDAGTPQQVAQDGRWGGRGEVANWQVAAQLAQQRSIWLAGGLSPDNIIRALEQVQPAGIDLVSGIEAQPGKKDPEKIRALFQRLHQNTALYKNITENANEN